MGKEKEEGRWGGHGAKGKRMERWKIVCGKAAEPSHSHKNVECGKVRVLGRYSQALARVKVCSSAGKKSWVPGLRFEAK
jgi:hypothetical protein